VLVCSAGDDLVVLSAEGVAGVVTEAGALFGGTHQVGEAHCPHPALQAHRVEIYDYGVDRGTIDPATLVRAAGIALYQPCCVQSLFVASASRRIFGPSIVGVRLVHLSGHTDPRGTFTEVFAAHWETGIAPVQWNIVRSQAGVLRGMHIHARHEELFCLIEGHATVGLHDMRADSATAGCPALYDLSAFDLAFISFPRGVLHGWLFHEPSIHLGATSEAFATYGEDDNNGCHWADPELGLPWPFEPWIVSERAAAFPRLQDLRQQYSMISVGSPKS
jgi:dTDP-4-dehydrorhamnose 3,5-epimerase